MAATHNPLSTRKTLAAPVRYTCIQTPARAGDALARRGCACLPPTYSCLAHSRIRGLPHAEHLRSNLSVAAGGFCVPSLRVFADAACAVSV